MSKETRGERIYEAIGEMIICGDLSPGSLLPKKRFADIFSVSVMPVTDAFHRLDNDGYLDVNARGAAAVVAYDPALISDAASMRGAILRVALGRALARPAINSDKPRNTRAANATAAGNSNRDYRAAADNTWFTYQEICLTSKISGAFTAATTVWPRMLHTLQFWCMERSGIDRHFELLDGLGSSRDSDDIENGRSILNVLVAGGLDKMIEHLRRLSERAHENQLSIEQAYERHVERMVAE